MRNIRPEHAIFRGEFERRPQAFGLHRHPNLPQPLRQDLPRPAFVVNAGLEFVERGLPHHGVQHILHLRRQHDPPLRRRRGVEQRAKRQHFPEHAGGFGQRQRGARHQISLLPSQDLVHAVAQLMRQRHNVARPSVIIQQQIGMRARHRRVREGTARFAGIGGRIDPGMVEEPLAHRRQLRAERAVGRQYAVSRVVPRDNAVVVARQRRVAVPVLQLLQAQPFGFHLVIPVRQPAVRPAHGGHQGIDNLVLHHVGPVAVTARLGIVPPRVVDLLVFGQGIGDQGK